MGTFPVVVELLMGDLGAFAKEERDPDVWLMGGPARGPSEAFQTCLYPIRVQSKVI